MLESLIPMVVMTGMFAMIFGIVYIRSRENLAMVEKGLNPRQKDVRPRPFINLKWGLLLIGSGLGLLFAYIIDNTIIYHDKTGSHHSTITIGDHHSSHINKVTVVADTNNKVKDTSLTAHSSTVTKDKDGDDDEDNGDLVIHGGGGDDSPAIYFALIAIGGGLGLFFSYRIEKKEWLDKKMTV